ncbi:hypothetical protein CgunFtcFv8_021581 [Champsocephalus gunnari]|uniref:Immunoglobulin subtype domain-containing protein n=1 Tax=Champsocephalus gunnari TaxID=52237 RepID=A0AAN8HRS7_CHAGU|nr:hypothetical protein CgunFtcFv8_021581 [Champsocephalus gunnari]
MLILLTLLHVVVIVAAPRPASPQTIQAVSGENATVWCLFIRPEHFAPTALHWTVNVTKTVLFSRHGGWIDPDAADAQYKLRTSVNWEDPARGTLLVNISNVTPSDSGSYEGVVSGKLAGHDAPLELHCSVELIVEEGRSQRKDSGAPAPPAEGGPAAERRNRVLGVLAALPAAVIAVLLVKLHVIRNGKKGGDPAVKDEELKELRTGAAEGGEDQRKEGSEVKDHNNEPKEPSGEV